MYKFKEGFGRFVVVLIRFIGFNRFEAGFDHIYAALSVLGVFFKGSCRYLMSSFRAFCDGFLPLARVLVRNSLPRAFPGFLSGLRTHGVVCSNCFLLQFPYYKLSFFQMVELGAAGTLVRSTS